MNKEINDLVYELAQFIRSYKIDSTLSNGERF